MFSIRKILFTVLLIGLTGGCSAIFGSYEGDEPARYTELRFEDQKPIKLKVSKVDVISEFTPSFRRPNVEHLFPIQSKRLLRPGLATGWKRLTSLPTKLPSSSSKMPA